MMRLFALLPIAILAGLTVWTAPYWLVYAAASFAGVFCLAGVLRRSISLITIGGSLALIVYALAIWLSNEGADMLGAVAFGLALLFLIDLTWFARRFHGAEIDSAAKRMQIAFWLGRAGVAVGAAGALILLGTVVAQIIPALGGPVVAGLGVVVAFAMALWIGIGRRETP